MHSDPAVTLLHEIRAVDRSLERALKQKNRDAIDWHLSTIAHLRTRIRQTIPTSVEGAGILLGEAVAQLQRAAWPHTARLQEISRRFSQGERGLADLVWLRAVERALSKGALGPGGSKVAQLIALALKGAARPAGLCSAPCSEETELPDFGLGLPYVAANAGAAFQPSRSSEPA